MERRTFLALGAAAVGLAGCTGQSPQPGPPSAPTTPTTPDDPDRALRAEVAASEAALIAAYRRAIAADPQLAADLEPFLAHHEEHLARIAPDYVPGSGSAEASTPSAASPPEPATSGSSPATAAPGSGSSAEAPSSGAAESPEVSISPPSAAEVLAELAAAESAGRAQRATACDGAQDPALARDLCLIAASEAQHAAALEGLAAQGSEP